MHKGWQESSDHLFHNPPNTPKPGDVSTGSRQVLFNPSFNFLQGQKHGNTHIRLKSEVFSMPKKIRNSYSLPHFDSWSTRILTPTILHHLHGDSQDSPKSDKVFQIKNLINQNQFSESLEVLEKSGVSGDFALFILKNIQLGGCENV